MPWMPEEDMEPDYRDTPEVFSEIEQEYAINNTLFGIVIGTIAVVIVIIGAILMFTHNSVK